MHAHHTWAAHASFGRGGVEGGLSIVETRAGEGGWEVVGSFERVQCGAGAQGGRVGAGKAVGWRAAAKSGTAARGTGGLVMG